MAITADMIKYFKLMKKMYGINFERTAMLGRQMLLRDNNSWGVENQQFEQSDGYSETLFRCLGAKHVDSFDCSDYENASCIFDMNLPISEKYKECYSFVFDGGTLEHIFNFPIAIKNAMEMVQKGGVFCTYAPVNNQNMHGLYQFSAELLIDLLANNGFEILDATLDIRKPTIHNSTTWRLSSGTYNSALANYKSKCTMVIITAKKVNDVPEVLKLQQSQCLTLWAGRKRAQKNAEYYELERELGESINKDKLYNKERVRVVLWGSGMICRKLLLSIREKKYHKKIDVVAIVDSDESKWGKSYYGYEICAPETITEYNNIDGIVIATGMQYQEEIEGSIIYKYNYPENKIFSMGQFEYYIGEKIYLK